MIAMLMMQTAVHNVINMVAVRHRLVPAAFAVDMITALMGMIASIGIGFVHIQHMLVIMAVVLVVQMAVVEIIHMVAVFNGRMAATGTVDMIVVFVGMAVAHGRLLLLMCRNRLIQYRQQHKNVNKFLIYIYF